ncbi:MAG: hypothetical protein IPO15_24175 [Anaerolineae bacterium]|uniref:hypothetical protein n=1 Tax=Candidatus Amarolinea dominans TaxID=3140696 RepID=UPI003134FE00|nr:hypothetical protein [Anaerolineae bacterium]
MAPRSSPSSWLHPLVAHWLTPGAATLALRAILVRQGITTHLLDRHLARRPLITYRRTRTDLRTLATGRVISRDVVEGCLIVDRLLIWLFRHLRPRSGWLLPFLAVLLALPLPAPSTRPAGRRSATRWAVWRSWHCWRAGG